MPGKAPQTSFQSFPDKTLRDIREIIGKLSKAHPTQAQFKKIIIYAIRGNRPGTIEHLRKYMSPYVMIRDAVNPHVQYYEVLIRCLTAAGVTVADQPTYEAVDRCLETLYSPEKYSHRDIGNDHYRITNIALN